MKFNGLSDKEVEQSRRVLEIAKIDDILVCTELSASEHQRRSIAVNRLRLMRSL